MKLAKSFSYKNRPNYTFKILLSKQKETGLLLRKLNCLYVCLSWHHLTTTAGLGVVSSNQKRLPCTFTRYATAYLASLYYHRN